jgi:hypothetical protein
LGCDRVDRAVAERVGLLNLKARLSAHRANLVTGRGPGEEDDQGENADCQGHSESRL